MNADPDRKRSGWAVTLAFASVIVILVVAAAGALGYMRVNTVKGDLQEASRQTKAYFAALSSSPGHADYYRTKAEKALNRAAGDLAKPPFPQVEWVPGLGANVVDTRTIVAQLQKMVTQTGPTLTKVATVIDFRTGRPRAHDSASEWAETLGNAKQAVKDMPDALDTFNSAADVIAGVDTSGLLPPLREALTSLQSQVGDAQKKLKVVSRAVNTLGPVLKALP